MGYLVLIAVLPGLLITYLIYKLDKKESEPKKELIKSFLIGCTAIAITLFISYLFDIGDYNLNSGDIWSVLFYSFILISLVEEFSKWICSYLFLKDNRNFNYLFDGIVYTTFISLGFATVENILYTLSGGIETGIMRAITTVPAHAFFGISSGYFITLAKREKLEGNSLRNFYYLVLSFIVPFLLHGFYDFCLLTKNYIFFIIYIVFMVSLYVFSISNVKRMMVMDKRFRKKKKNKK